MSDRDKLRLGVAALLFAVGASGHAGDVALAIINGVASAWSALAGWLG